MGAAVAAPLAAIAGRTLTNEQLFDIYVQPHIDAAGDQLAATIRRGFVPAGQWAFDAEDRALVFGGRKI